MASKLVFSLIFSVLIIKIANASISKRSTFDDCPSLRIISKFLEKNSLDTCNRLFSIFCCLNALKELDEIEYRFNNVDKIRTLKNNGNVVAGWQVVEPNLWSEKFPNDCSKRSQSPINIKTSNTVLDRALKDFVIKNFKTKYEWKMNYDGYSVEFAPIYKNDSKRIEVTGSNLGKTVFQLVNFHFHWRKDSNEGSEHRIDGKQSEGEVHLVFKSTINNQTKLMKLLIKLSNLKNKKFGFIVDQLKKKVDTSNEFIVNQNLISDPFSLQKLIPSWENIRQKGYYRYNGSLTVPPCTEGVIWNVFREKIPISKSQSKIFDGKKRVSHRPVQPLNSRTVFRSASTYIY